MKRKTVATIAIVTLLLVLMIWSFGSSAANQLENAPEQNPSAAEQSSAVFQDQEDEKEPDADLGKFGSRINREEYLRARDEYIARKRGIEPGRQGQEPGSHRKGDQRLGDGHGRCTSLPLSIAR